MKRKQDDETYWEDHYLADIERENPVRLDHDDAYRDEHEWHKLNGPIRTYKIGGDEGVRSGNEWKTIEGTQE